MRTISAARMKGNSMGHANKVPTQGSRLRKIWDMFQGSRGVVLKVGLPQEDKNAIQQLRDFYGLDIRCIKYGHWCLCGEWVVGGGYIDYVAARHQDAVDG
jgi:hypothetical protein